MKDETRNTLDTLPFSREEQRHTPRVTPASAALPKHLQAKFSSFKPAAIEHIKITRNELSKVADAPLEPFQPGWLCRARKPERPHFEGVPVRKLNHHGFELDPMFVTEPDERKLYSDTNYPWGCVCRILPNGLASGSGVLIGPRHVLTASHVVDWSTTSGSVEVHRAGAYASAVSSYRTVIAFSELVGDSRSYSEVDEDYAVIITDKPLGKDFGWFGVRTYHSDWDDEPYWWNIGYSYDLFGFEYPLYQSWVSLDEDEFDFGPARALKTFADVWHGQSGSPMFGFWQDGPYVVAVVSSGGKILFGSRGTYCSAGSYLTKLATLARSLYP